MDITLRPLSPATEQLFSLFTGLYDDVLDVSQLHQDHPDRPGNAHPQVRGDTEIQQANPSRKKRSNVAQRATRSRKRNLKPTLPGFMCFSAKSGETVKAARRTPFTDDRREEVNQLRKRGACLRCRLRKITCSGDDPCKPCLSVAQAKLGSRALSWMDCVRPSFDMFNVMCDPGVLLTDGRSVEYMVSELLNRDDISFQGTLPIDMSLHSGSNYVRWHVPGTGTPYFSINSFSHESLAIHTDLTNLVLYSPRNAATDSLRTFAHLTTLKRRERGSSHHLGHSIEDIHRLCDQTESILLSNVAQWLKPLQQWVSESNSFELEQTFAQLIAFSICIGFMIANHSRTTTALEVEEKGGQMSQVLTHYIVYIGKMLGFISDSHDEKFLINHWRNEWSSLKGMKWSVTPHTYSGRCPIVAPNRGINGPESSQSGPRLQPCASCQQLCDNLDFNTRCSKCAGIWATQLQAVPPRELAYSMAPVTTIVEGTPSEQQIWPVNPYFQMCVCCEQVSEVSDSNNTCAHCTSACSESLGHSSQRPPTTTYLEGHVSTVTIPTIRTRSIPRSLAGG